MPELKTLFFFFIEEGAMVAYLGLALLGIRLPVKKAALIGLMQGISVFLVRTAYVKFEIPFGTHTILLVLTLVLFMKLIGKVRWGVAMTAALIGFIIVILSESLVMPPIYESLNLTLDKVLSEGWLNIVMGYVCDILLLIMTALVAFTKITLIELPNRGFAE